MHQHSKEEAENDMNVDTYGKLERAREIAAAAEREDRDLTKDEEREFNQLLRAVDMDRVARQEPAPEGTRVYSDTEARALHRDERAVDFLRTRGRLGDTEAFEGVGLGAYLRSILVGPKTPGERRALNETTNSAGGFTTPEILSAQLIDRLRPVSHVMRAGAQTVILDSDRHRFARVATDPSPTWRSELDPVAPSEPSFDSVLFEPKSCAFVVVASRELLQDSVNLETALPDMVARVMASELDRVALVGSDGNGEPVGLLNMAGVSEFDMLSTPFVSPTDGDGYRPFLRVRRSILEANAPEPGFAIMSPAVGEQVASLTSTSGQPLRMPQAIEGWTFAETTQVPVTGGGLSSAFVGNFRNLWIGQRLAINVQVLTEAFATSNWATGFLVSARWDVQSDHPAALGRLVNILADENAGSS